MTVIIDKRWWFNRATGALGEESTVWVQAEAGDVRGRHRSGGIDYMWQSTGCPWLDVEATSAKFGVDITSEFVMPDDSEWWDGPISLVPQPGWVEIPRDVFEAARSFAEDVVTSATAPLRDEDIVARVTRFIISSGVDPSELPELKPRDERLKFGGGR